MYLSIINYSTHKYNYKLNNTKVYLNKIIKIGDKYNDLFDKFCWIKLYFLNNKFNSTYQRDNFQYVNRKYKMYLHIITMKIPLEHACNRI